MDGFDSYAEWLAVAVDRRPPNHYELLGLKSGESDPALIRAASIKRSARVRRYCLGPHGAEATRLLGELGAAFACLSDPKTKAAYDRQLLGNAAADSSADVCPPPIQHHFDTADEEAPPRRSNAVEKKASPAGRSYLPPGRRAVSSSGPARFTIAAAIFFAASCGALLFATSDAVWLARRPTEDARRGTDVRPTSVASTPSAASSGNEPLRANWQPKSPAPKDAKRSAPPPSRAGSAAGDAATAAEVPPKEEARPARPTEETSDEVDTAPAGPSNSVPAEQSNAADASNAADTSNAAAERRAVEQEIAALRRRFRPPGFPRAAFEPPDSESDEQVRGRSGVAPQGVGNARILYPDQIWTLNARDEPESLEATFENPVDAAYIELIEPSAPPTIERAVVESADGSTAEIKPVLVFHQDGKSRWSLGTKRRAPISRLLIHFRPTADGVIVLERVWVRDRAGDTYFPKLVQAVRKASDPAKAAPATAQEGEGTGTEQKDSAENEDPIEELARQVLKKAQGGQPRRADDYRVILGDRVYVRTKAAIEAVSDLEQIINDRPKSTDATVARGLLRAAAQKDTPVGAAAAKALTNSQGK